ncbi:MAG: zincin-like metallopeptidase domain-containing protein, partial [Rhabdochlamydiaceae bacterium]
ADQYKNGEIVIFYKMSTWVDKKDLDKDGKPKVKGYPILRFYTVYNIEQTEGIEYETALYKNNPIEACEALVKEYKDCPPISHINGHAPCYNPEEDTIQLPEITTYQTPEYYYRSLFHEMTHSTGHDKRLNRFIAGESTNFGSETYSKEELVAELGAAFLCAQTRTSNEDMEKYSASYVKGWLQALKNDKKLVIEAAGKAQKALDYIKEGAKLTIDK